MNKTKYDYYFYSILSFLVVVLIFKADLSLSISYKEALNVFVNNSLLSVITNISIYMFGQNDVALRLPFILFYLLSVILMYKITDNYFRYEKDRFISILIFMILPGLISASLLVNSAIIVIFFTLLYVYIVQKYNKHSYFLLVLYLFIDNSFAIFYMAIFLYSLKNEDKKLRYISIVLFFLSMYIYGFDTDGKPRGFLVDTFAIYATVFSPLLFLYFTYTIYRAGIKKDFSLSWYISVTAFALSIIFSLRQRIYIEDFAPYVIISLPLMLKTFLHSYRVRLKEFRKFYNILAIIIIGMLLLNVFVTFFNKPLYLLLPNPSKHFVYQYHFAKEIAEELKNRKINNIFLEDKELSLRLKFYQINEGEEYFASLRPFYNYDEKITINYYGMDMISIYLKKL